MHFVGRRFIQTNIAIPLERVGRVEFVRRQTPGMGDSLSQERLSDVFRAIAEKHMKLKENEVVCPACHNVVFRDGHHICVEFKTAEHWKPVEQMMKRTKIPWGVPPVGREGEQ